nr:GNAT family N-acetyltransferase [Actinomycetota bacterium]
LQPVSEPSARVLHYLADVDHDRRQAIAAEVDGEIVGVARYDVLSEGDGREAEVAVLVEDAWQRHGLGRRLVQDLAELAAERGVEAFTAIMLGENRAALHLLRSLAPKARVHPDHGELAARIPLALAG